MLFNTLMVFIFKFDYIVKNVKIVFFLILVGITHFVIVLWVKLGNNWLGMYTIL